MSKNDGQYLQRRLLNQRVSLDRVRILPSTRPSSVYRITLGALATTVGTCLLLVVGLHLWNSLFRISPLKPFINSASENLANTPLTADNVEGYWGLLPNYEAWLAFLVEQFDISPDWFHRLLYSWVEANDLDWKALSDAEKIEIATELLGRLISVLHPDTWQLLGSHTEFRLVEWTDSPKSLKFALPDIDPVTNTEFYRIFPELKGKSLEGTAFEAVWQTLRQSLIKDRFVEVMRNSFTEKICSIRLG